MHSIKPTNDLLCVSLRGMAMVKAILSLAVSAALLVDLATARSYTIGGSGGSWDTSTNLRAWASSQTFFVGDVLVFKYPPNHDVREVSSKIDYDACSGSNPLESHTGGNTVVPLTSPGARYFICGTMGHCSLGMKVEIHTLAASALSPENPPLASPSPESGAFMPVTPSPAPAPAPIDGLHSESGAFPPSSPAPVEDDDPLQSSPSPESGVLMPVALSPAPAPIDSIHSKGGAFPPSLPAPVEDEDALQSSPSPESGPLMPETLSPAPAPIDVPIDAQGSSVPAPMNDDALQSSPTLGSGALKSPLGSSDGSSRVLPSAESVENSTPPSYPAAGIDALIQCLVGFGFTMAMLHTL